MACNKCDNGRFPLFTTVIDCPYCSGKQRTKPLFSGRAVRIAIVGEAHMCPNPQCSAFLLNRRMVSHSAVKGYWRCLICDMEYEHGIVSLPSLGSRIRLVCAREKLVQVHERMARIATNARWLCLGCGDNAAIQTPIGPCWP